MNGRRTVFMFADSVSMPSVPKAVPRVLQSQTWSELVRRQLKAAAPEWDLVGDGRFNRTTTEARDRIDEIAAKGDVVVFQLGINDSSPRVLLPNELAFMSRYLPKYVQYYVQGAIHILRVQIMYVFRGRVYTSEQDFEANLRLIFARLKKAGKRVLYVGIAPTHRQADRHNPGMVRNIRRYNQILREVASEEGVPLVDVEHLIGPDEIPNCISRDGAHLGPKGHAVVAENLLSQLVPILKATGPDSSARGPSTA